MIWNLLLQGGMGFFGYNIFQINVRGVLMCLVITAIVQGISIFQFHRYAKQRILASRSGEPEDWDEHRKKISYNYKIAWLYFFKLIGYTIFTFGAAYIARTYIGSETLEYSWSIAGLLEVKFALLTLTWAFGWTIFAYSVYAKSQGLVVGKFYADDLSYLKLSALIGIVVVPVLAVVLFPWWYAILIVVFGFLVAMAITHIFREKVQIVALVGFVACGLVDIVYVAP